MKRSGVADLPLHGGRVPAWLAERMTRLGTAIAESVLHHYGPSGAAHAPQRSVLVPGARLVMGMDWHSSGITTSVLGALKRGLNPRAAELGIYVCGGRGRHSRKHARRAAAMAERHGPRRRRAGPHQPADRASIDNNAIADGFQIYLHTFIVSGPGRMGRRAAGHERIERVWRAAITGTRAAVRDFICEPHTAIVGEHQGVDPEPGGRGTHGRPSRRCWQQSASRPEATLAEMRQARRCRATTTSAREDVDLKRLGAVLAVAYERDLRDFASLLLLENLGPRTLQSLALVAEVVHGAPDAFSDPARFSFALRRQGPPPVPRAAQDVR